MSLIALDKVSKRYRRPESGHAPTLSGTVMGYDRKRHENWVLRQISLSVRRGESLAILGANGSGKSTLLRIIAGLTKPTTGSVKVHGQVSALLTLGEMLDGLMSGEENAYTALLVAGFSPKEARRRLPAVAEFAELEAVFDHPLRTYSSGMKMRLAFSAAVNSDPELLLIDEVLAVGDSRFQAKCAERMDALRSGGTTMVIVSHSVISLRRLTQRAAWLDDGLIRAIGPIGDVADQYQLAMTPRAEAPASMPGGGYRVGTGEAVEITKIGLFNVDGTNVETLLPGSPVSLRLRLTAKRHVPELVVGFSIHRASDGAQALDLSNDKDQVKIVDVSGGREVRLNLDRLDLSGGLYVLNAGVFSPDFEHCYDYRWGSLHFMMAGDETAAPMAPPREWTVLLPTKRGDGDRPDSIGPR